MISEVKGINSLGNLYNLGKIANISTFNIPADLVVPGLTTLRYDFVVEEDSWLAIDAFQINPGIYYNFFNYTTNRYWAVYPFSITLIFLFNYLNNRPAFFMRKNDKYRIEITNKAAVPSETKALFYFANHDKDFEYQFKLFPHIWFSMDSGVIANQEKISFYVDMKGFKQNYFMGTTTGDETLSIDNIFFNIQFDDNKKLFNNWIPWNHFVYNNYHKFDVSRKQIDILIWNRSGAPIQKNVLGLFFATNY